MNKEFYKIIYFHLLNKSAIHFSTTICTILLIYSIFKQDYLLITISALFFILFCFLYLISRKVYIIDLAHNTIKFPKFNSTISDLIMIKKASGSCRIVSQKLDPVDHVNTMLYHHHHPGWASDEIEELSLPTYVLVISCSSGSKEFCFYEKSIRDKIYNILKKRIDYLNSKLYNSKA